MIELLSNNEVSDEKIIQEQIESDLISNFKQYAKDGENYYNSNNTNIKSRNSTNFLSNFNHQVAHGFFKKIVDQKVNYLLGKKLTINNADNILKILNINKFIKYAAKIASRQGVCWLHPFVNSQGEFDVKIIDGIECIPIFDTEYQTTLTTLIRYYHVDVITGKERVKRYKVEVYNDKGVKYYMQDEKGNYYFDTEVSNNPNYYLTFNTVLQEKIIDTQFNTWGKIPFIPLWNNDEKLSDLVPVQDHIDLYDIVKSDFGNNLDQIQDSLLVIINRMVGNSNSEYQDFLNRLKQRKIIELDESGDARFLTLDLPFEARETFLKLIRDDIYEFSNSVDTKKIGDGNITNVVIKSRYADLDLKCDDFETMIENSLNDLFWFANRYLEMKNNGKDDLNSIEYIFNRKMIFNKSELVKDFVDQGGRISNETLLGVHPDVNDVEDEVKKLDEEDVNYNDLNGSGDDE